ncbi:MAG: hypothetical protein FJ245_12870 [Nitrospira sp.]|nr:hypothetical protein [Nitrospira sp.]
MTVNRLFGLVSAMLLWFAMGASAFAADQPIEDGSTISITSPKDGDMVGSTFDLKYELTKGSQAAHAHVYLDGQYQKGFGGTFQGIAPGKHQITVTGATKDHKPVAATQMITVEVR